MMLVTLLVFLILIVLSMPMFNPSIRQVILETMDKQQSEYHYKLFSLLPVIVVFMISFVFPNIEGILAFFSASVILFDGIILPIMLKIKMMKMSNKPNVYIYINWTLVLILFILMFATTYYEGSELAKEFFGKKKD